MKYVEITVAIPAVDAERAADMLRVVTGAAPWIDFPFAQPDLECDAVVAPDGAAFVRAYVAEDADHDRLTAEILQALVSASITGAVSTRIADEVDWAEAWKAHFDVERYGDRIVVVPSWREYDPAAEDAVIHLDPGMAFGTGQHETTRMCLEAIERRITPGDVVLDVGCGSGILSLAAAKLDAREVFAVDIDPDCVRITTENAHRNGVEAIVRADIGTLGDAWPFAASPARAFDLIVANILARPIIEMAMNLCAALRDGGCVIASGVIGEREREVVAALLGTGLRIDGIRAIGDWRCLEAVPA